MLFSVYLSELSCPWPWACDFEIFVSFSWLWIVFSSYLYSEHAYCDFPPQSFFSYGAYKLPYGSKSNAWVCFSFFLLLFSLAIQFYLDPRLSLSFTFKPICLSISFTDRIIITMLSFLVCVFVPEKAFSIFCCPFLSLSAIVPIHTGKNNLSDEGNIIGIINWVWKTMTNIDAVKANSQSYRKNERIFHNIPDMIITF